MFPMNTSVTSSAIFTTAAPQSFGCVARQFFLSSANTILVASRSSPTSATWLDLTKIFSL